MKTKKATVTLSLNKLQITKLNNLEVIRGGNGNNQSAGTTGTATITSSSVPGK